uniref:Uncharacterized protein n=1 Tax=Panagrolaimus davidi TaxID=227884 RepID=A0A914QML3_9BILA
MGLSNSETTLSDILMRYDSKNAPFRSTYQRQAFPFRDTLIRYITNNPSSAKVYQKMIQSCKYFFIKNPIIIIPKLCSDDAGWYTQVSRPSKNRRSVSLNELTSKIWVTDLLSVCWSTPTLLAVASFMQKIYQCDATSVFIRRQMFSFNDLMIIASKSEMLDLSNVVVINNDEIVPKKDQFYFEAAVSLEALLKALPNVKNFT